MNSFGRTLNDGIRPFPEEMTNASPLSQPPVWRGLQSGDNTTEALLGLVLANGPSRAVVELVDHASGHMLIESILIRYGSDIESVLCCAAGLPDAAIPVSHDL